MNRDEGRSILKPEVSRVGGGLFTVIRGPCANRRCVLYLNGPLRTPLNGALRHTVRALLRRGERNIVLDLNAVPRIDASGVGELVRAYNIATTAGAVFHVVDATGWVRQILELVGLLDILTEGEGPAITSMAR
jgi:anti-sigma B factor antagonist